MKYRIRMHHSTGWTDFPEGFEDLEEAKATVRRIVRVGGFWVSDTEFALLGESLSIEDTEDMPGIERFGDGPPLVG